MKSSRSGSQAASFEGKFWPSEKGTQETKDTQCILCFLCTLCFFNKNPLPPSVVVWRKKEVTKVFPAQELEKKMRVRRESQREEKQRPLKEAADQQEQEQERQNEEIESW